MLTRRTLRVLFRKLFRNGRQGILKIHQQGLCGSMPILYEDHEIALSVAKFIGLAPHVMLGHFDVVQIIYSCCTELQARSKANWFRSSSLELISDQPEGQALCRISDEHKCQGRHATRVRNCL